jgi:NTP pyrophosphatase (non-canonical NTP hydrolase)
MAKSLAQITDDISELAKAKRWGTKLEEVNVLEKFALIHSEVSEALTAYRNKRFEGKDCLKEELADIILRVLHLASILGIDDLEQEIDKKIEANYGRDWSHKNETLAKE